MDNKADRSEQNVRTSISQESDEKLVAGLENILEKQLRLMRSSRDNAAFDLSDRTSEFVNALKQKQLLENEQFAQQRKNIQRLFNELTLVTAEKKTSVASELNKLRIGKNSLKAYKSEASSTYSNLL